MSTNAICDAILISVFNKLGLRILDHIPRLQRVAEVLRHSHKYGSGGTLTFPNVHFRFKSDCTRHDRYMHSQALIVGF
jgi:hypothetical protein